MSRASGSRIAVEKTLHLQDAFVCSMGYVSASRPVLASTLVLSGKRKGEIIRRVSEDNGRTWAEAGNAKYEEKRGDRVALRFHPVYFADSDSGVLIEFVTEYEQKLGRSIGPEIPEYLLELWLSSPEQLTGRIFYRFSKDDGRSWGAWKQLIQSGAAYDAVHWADGIYYGKNAGYFDEALRAVKLKDGAIIVPIYLSGCLDEDGKFLKLPDRFGDVIWPVSVVACFRGEWRADRDDYEWEMSNHVTLPEYMSRDLAEPAVAEVADGKLMMIIRGSASAWQSFSGVKFFAISKDGGRTWGPAVPLTYPDGSFVHSPASLPNLFRSSKNGKVYLIANILPGPCRQSDPRYPLVIAEVDPKYYWVLPETVTVIEDRQDGQPSLVRFSNWQRIEDRETGNPVIYMTAARADAFVPGTPGVILPHSYRYEIKLPD